MSTLSLAQRLGLVKFLTDRLAELRKEDLLPQATAQMPPGARLPVIFGEELAGWATMPKPSVTVSVTDDAAFLAWARKHHPEKVQEITEVVVDDDLIAYLADTYPLALRTTFRVSPRWADDICAGLKARGRYVTRNGDVLTDVPGVTVGSTTPSPRVTLDDNAAEVIGAAWRDGSIPVGDFLALPAGAGKARGAE